MHSGTLPPARRTHGERRIRITLRPVQTGQMSIIKGISRLLFDDLLLSGDGFGSIYEALTADARKGHGLAPTFWAFDELAQVSDFELLDNLETVSFEQGADACPHH